MKPTLLLVFLLLAGSCGKESIEIPSPARSDLVLAADISNYPEIEASGSIFYDSEGKAGDFLTILKKNGINTIRLRIWHQPKNRHSGFEEVKIFSEKLKKAGFKIWLTLHYSDSWADPSQQKIPAAWQNLSFALLKDSLYNYTEKIVKEIGPDYIQIGNEINSGFLHPYGHLSDNQKFKELLGTGIRALRTHKKDTKIILHYAGLSGSDWFFDQLKGLDYDMIGLSFYPIWHGKSLSALDEKMQALTDRFSKKIILAETAYPFTLGWNDWTNNIVGLDNQLILPDFPATAEGQQKFVRAMRLLSTKTESRIGFCYWGAELIAWKGAQSASGSSWENQALFDFENKALPVLKAFEQ